MKKIIFTAILGMFAFTSFAMENDTSASAATLCDAPRMYEKSVDEDCREGYIHEDGYCKPVDANGEVIRQ